MNWKNCTGCNLCKTRTQVVWGKGKNTGILLLGEAPGSDEDIIGEPFVGRCGELLTKMLKQCGVSREDVYITNVVKCRPVEGKKNRPPKKEEIDACKAWLWSELKQLKPKVIVTLGKVPTGLLLKLKKTFKLGDHIGKAHELDYLDAVVVPCYHPSYLMQTGKGKMDVSLESIKTAVGLNNVQ